LGESQLTERKLYWEKGLTSVLLEERARPGVGNGGGMLADAGRNGCSNGKEKKEMEAKKEENLGDG
jgi:hypothetical protein